MATTTKKSFIIAAIAAFALTALPQRAAADVFFTPFAGVTFKGDSAKNKVTGGAALTFMGKVAGVEFDFGYSPDFFGEQSGVALVSDSNVTSFSANILIGLGPGRVHPYVTGGVGVLRTRIDVGDLFDDVSSNDWGVNGGGGVIGMLSGNVGLRGDLRYFRLLQDANGNDDLNLTIGNFDFWRATLGVTFKF